MAKGEEYELLPKEEVDMLKKEVERLKKHPFGELKEGENILDAINNLNESIRKLIDIFTKAEADLAEEYAEESPGEDLRTIKEQNEQLAQGLVAVAGMVKEIKDMKEAEKPISPGPRMPMTRPTGYGMPPSPEPLPGEFPPLTPGEGPPPPFEEPFPKKKHRGLFSRK